MPLFLYSLLFPEQINKMKTNNGKATEGAEKNPPNRVVPADFGVSIGLSNRKSRIQIRSIHGE